MKKVIAVLLVSLCLCSVLTSAVTADSNKNTMNIYGLYLTAEGDATLIESNGKWLLIDTGMESSATELVRKLSSYGVREVDVLISHLHNDHSGGFAALAESKVKINRLYVPDAKLTPHDPDTAWKHNQLKKAATANNAQVVITELSKSDSFTFGNVTATVLGPVSNVTPDDFEATNEQTALEIYGNCRSLTVRFDCGDASYLSAGDIEQKEEQALIAAYKGTKKLDVDIMKLSHHALHTSNTPEFLAMVTPRYSFAHNSNKTISEGMDYRMYYTSCKNASAYGPVYLIGDEKTDIHVEASGDTVKLFKGSKELKGMVSLAGGDGTVTKTYKYYITGDRVKEGVYTINGKKYYISEGGFVNKGYYSHLDDKYVYRYEPVKGGDVRYFDLEGVMYTGFCQVGEYYYYFDEKTGVQYKGKGEDLSMVTIGDKMYALYPSGVVYNYGTGKSVWREFGDTYRRFDEYGVMQTGWFTLNEKKYYLDPETGLRVVGLKKIDGDTYYFVETNNAAYAWCDGWKNFDGQYRYFEADGKMKTGWLTVNDKKYYLDESTGYRTVGLKEIDGDTYYFVETNNAAYAWCGGWKNIDGQRRYFGEDGKEVVEDKQDPSVGGTTKTTAKKSTTTTTTVTTTLSSDTTAVVDNPTQDTTHLTTVKPTDGKTNNSSVATPDESVVDTTTIQSVTNGVDDPATVGDTTTGVEGDSTTDAEEDTTAGTEEGNITTVVPPATRPDDTSVDVQPEFGGDDKASPILLVVVLSVMVIVGGAIGAFFLLGKKKSSGETAAEGTTEE